MQFVEDAQRPPPAQQIHQRDERMLLGATSGGRSIGLLTRKMNETTAERGLPANFVAEYELALVDLLEFTGRHAEAEHVLKRRIAMPMQRFNNAYTLSHRLLDADQSHAAIKDGGLIRSGHAAEMNERLLLGNAQVALDVRK